MDQVKTVERIECNLVLSFFVIVFSGIFPFNFILYNLAFYRNPEIGHEMRYRLQKKPLNPSAFCLFFSSYLPPPPPQLIGLAVTADLYIPQPTPISRRIFIGDVQLLFSFCFTYFGPRKSISRSTLSLMRC